ncbi:Os09g0448500, partial [Oryza sativa Japonica Group]
GLFEKPSYLSSRPRPLYRLVSSLLTPLDSSLILLGNSLCSAALQRHGGSSPRKGAAAAAAAGSVLAFPRDGGSEKQQLGRHHQQRQQQRRQRRRRRRLLPARLGAAVRRRLPRRPRRRRPRPLPTLHGVAAGAAAAGRGGIAGGARRPSPGSNLARDKSKGNSFLQIFVRAYANLLLLQNFWDASSDQQQQQQQVAFNSSCILQEKTSSTTATATTTNSNSNFFYGEKKSLKLKSFTPFFAYKTTSFCHDTRRAAAILCTTMISWARFSRRVPHCQRKAWQSHYSAAHPPTARRTHRSVRLVGPSRRPLRPRQVSRGPHLAAPPPRR